jgi:hypothetical protein
MTMKLLAGMSASPRPAGTSTLDIAGGLLLLTVGLILLAKRQRLFDLLNGIYFGVELDRKHGRGRAVYAVAYVLVPTTFVIAGIGGLAVGLS